MTGAATLRTRVALALLGLVLALRLLVPAGWMPSGKGGFTVTICTGSAMEAAWVDTEGKVHKQAPAQGGDQHCAFAGLGAPMLGGGLPPAIAPLLPADAAPATTRALASIGQGLAAPPPPATGPPATV
ncbi:hypothetical protein OF829_09525 [Sphingomonas sp. LB-2]|uniref:hypothetical protein n=1 Tax=Sphingomonas caeni TaxID=2984949 RepID=UPI002230E58F|nr:hypothetical protein [Sphingomonas caeni]MCW3847482.1 hypothetical protein [Sphingomonas caeni]